MQTIENITLKRLLVLTAERQASDLHLVVGNKPVMRAAGNLITLNDEEVITQDFLVNVSDNILNKDQKQELINEKEVIFAYDFLDQNRFRVDINWQRNLLSINFHHLSSIVRRLSDLEFPREVIGLTEHTHGLILVGGEQGSGKTTTLAAIVETINHREAKHILTLEKPIEYSLVSYQSIIEQQEIGTDVRDWLLALDIEEQDIDILIISKIATASVLKKVLLLAQSGILVCAAHESGTTEFLLESLLNMIDPKERNFYAKIFAEVYQGSVIQKLLPKVGGGQVLALEVAFNSLPLNSAIRELRFEQIPNNIQTGRAEGMITMDRYLLELVKSGQIDKEQAIKEAKNKDLFETKRS